MHRFSPPLIVQLLMLMSLSGSRVSSLSSTMKKSATSTTKNLNIHWFRHQDLRLHDNPALCRTVQDSATDGSSSVLPIFCVDPRFVGGETVTPFGSVKCGSARAKFILESVEDLRRNLEGRGSGLVVAYGKSEDVFADLLRSFNGSNEGGDGSSSRWTVNVFCQREVASEELKVDRALERVLEAHGNGGVLNTIWGSTLYDPDDLPFEGTQGMPDVFTPFRNKVEKKCEIGLPLPIPSKSSLSLPKDDVILSNLKEESSNSVRRCSLTYMPTLDELSYTAEQIDAAADDPRGVMTFRGGETAGRYRVQDYIFDRDLLKTYFDTRNGMLGGDYSTKFSPWLAHGCISPRYVAQQCRRYEEERGISNKSTYWVVFELLWRDFFKFFADKHGDSIFSLEGTLGEEARGSHPNSRRWGLNRKHLELWKEGKTGYPLVDANMRELAATGFMSNRGRQNVASFLAIDMNTDWRYGADHFEMHLLDYDVYSNWGNWCAAAGMTGGRLNRFNTVKQSKDYDARGDYIRHWCPELGDLPTSLVHEPWQMSKDQQKEFGVRLGVDYPNPLISPRGPNTYSGPRNGKENGNGDKGKRRNGGKQGRGGGGRRGDDRRRGQR